MTTNSTKSTKKKQLNAIITHLKLVEIRNYNNQNVANNLLWN